MNAIVELARIFLEFEVERQQKTVASKPASQGQGSEATVGKTEQPKGSQQEHFTMLPTSRQKGVGR